MAEKKLINVEDFKQEAIKRFGEDAKYWKFVCPKCGTIQSAMDFREHTDVKLGDISQYIGFSCIGRFTDKMGCDWTLGGLFKIHKIEIIAEDGSHHPRFELAKAEKP